MESLSDEQLKEVFHLCDSNKKGYITPTDLQSLNSDPESTDYVLNLLQMGPNDTLDLNLFLARVRGLNGENQQEPKFEIEQINQEHQDQLQHQDLQQSDEFRLQHNDEILQHVEDQRPRFKRHQSSRSFKSTPITQRRASISDVFAMSDDTVVLTSPGKDNSCAKLPRFMTSSRAALTLSKNRENDFVCENRRVSDIFSPSGIEGDNFSLSQVTFSQSLTDLSIKMSEIQASQLHGQQEFKSLICRMSTNLQNENERRLDQLMTIVEDRLSTKTLDPEEEKHLRCQIEKLESEKRGMHLEISSLRDRVLDLTNSIEVRDEELARERRISDDLENRLGHAEQEVERLREERHQLRHVNRNLMTKVEALSREIHETLMSKEKLFLDTKRMEKDKATLAYEFAALAAERGHRSTTNNQSFDGRNDFRLNFSIEEDEHHPVNVQPYPRASGEVMSQILEQFSIQRGSKADEKGLKLCSKIEEKDRKFVSKVEEQNGNFETTQSIAAKSTFQSPRRSKFLKHFYCLC